jgi:hypothetical protein
VGKLLYSTVGCGDAEGAGVGTTGPLVELQAGRINNPKKLLNTSINVFFISYPWLSTNSSTQRELARIHFRSYLCHLLSLAQEVGVHGFIGVGFAAVGGNPTPEFWLANELTMLDLGGWDGVNSSLLPPP